jgi:hypothetical protein
MTVGTIARRGHNFLERLFDALIDPVRGERTLLLVLAGYLAAWWLYAVVAQSSQDIHSDMGEMIGWSRDAALGTPKHPPFGAWLVRVWFTVFPRQDWAYYLFAMALPTLALWVTWRIADRYLPKDKQLLAVVLLSFVPFYNFQAIKYNANSVLTPLWATTTWWFLRSFETRRLGWAFFAGVGAAAAMLGKYWSVLLLVGLVLAVLTDRRSEAYFASLAPYATLATGTALLTPHIDWLISHHFVSFGYAIEAHTTTFKTALSSAFKFIGGSFLYVAAPILCTLLAARPAISIITDTLWPSDPTRRTLVLAFALPLLLAALSAPVLIVEIHSLWSICAMTLLPVVLLGSPLVTISRRDSIRLLAFALAFPILAVAASPLIALINHHQGVPDYRSDYRLVARAVERIWSEHTDQPLQIIGGTTLVDGVVFYFDKQPETFNIDFPTLTPWVDDDRIRADGLAIVCAETDPFCMRELQGYSAHLHAVSDEHVVIARHFFGTDDAPARFEIAIILPQAR